MSLQEVPTTLAPDTKIPKRSRPSLARMSQMERRAEALLQRVDPLGAFVESARDYSKQGIDQLRRVGFWMRKQVESRAALHHAVPDELSQRRELRRQREIVTPAVGITAVQPISELSAVIDETVTEPEFEYVTPMLRGLPFRDSFPHVEDLSQLTPSQILGWLNQDDYMTP